MLGPVRRCGKHKAVSYPRVQFTAIIDPSSGPGNGVRPSEIYSQAIKKLHSFDNVHTVGYVATTWAMKSMSLVLGEIEAYAEWGNCANSLVMNGILLGEVSTHCTAKKRFIPA